MSIDQGPRAAAEGRRGADVMSALVVDSESLDLARDLILAGKPDAAVAALTALTTRSPRSDERLASSKQLGLLSGLTIRGYLDWKHSLLSLADAKRMIGELLEDGETKLGEELYTITEKGKAIRARKTRKSTIPF